MSRYAAMFAALAGRREGAFGAFTMLGDPNLPRSAAILDALVAAGADMIEVGIPFSDPIADGPVIQAAADRALGAGVRTADCFELLRDFRSRHPQVPVGILTYANLVLARGIDHFYATAGAVGVDSVLVADVPLIEAKPFVAAARQAVIDPVLIATPLMTGDRIAALARLGQGYTYCVARPGVTGADAAIALDHDEMLGALRGAGAPPPVFGFGISRPVHVRQALDAGGAGVICGSAIVDRIAAGDPESLAGFVAAMKAATLPAARPDSNAGPVFARCAAID